MMQTQDRRNASQDRRRAPRYPAAVDRAQVGWWEDKQFRTAPARLTDISSGGASLVLDGQGVPSSFLWMCLVGEKPTGWISANLAGAQTSEDGVQLVRLAFAESCPYEVFKTAVWGSPSSQMSAPPPILDRRAPRAGVATGEQPPSDECHPVPVQRPPDPLALDRMTRVVLVSPLAPMPPTLWEAEQSQRVLKDRLAVLPWALTSVMSLIVVTLIGIITSSWLGHVRLVESFLAASKD
jgi:hypothetical protein